MKRKLLSMLISVIGTETSPVFVAAHSMPEVQAAWGADGMPDIGCHVGMRHTSDSTKTTSISKEKAATVPVEQLVQSIVMAYLDELAYKASKSWNDWSMRRLATDGASKN